MKLKQYILIAAFAFAGGIIGGLLFCQFFIGTAAIAETGIAKEIKAEQFTLVNKAGKPMSLWQVINDNYSSFSMSDPSGNPAIILTAKGDQNSLILSGKKGDVLIFGAKRFNGISMSKADGSEVWIGSGETTASIVLTDYSGNKASLGNCKLETTKTGAVVNRPASSLVLFNKDGNVVWSTPE